MMNRYAELLFWAGRYIERAGNYARLIDVKYHMRYELYGHQNREYIWARLVETTGDIRRFEELYSNINAGTNELTVLHFLTFERSNNNSIFACVLQARNNIRTLRQLVAAELWEMVNSFYVWLKDQNVSQMMLQSPCMFYQKVREWTTLISGAIDTIMIRGQEWNFIQAGKHIERADNTLRIIQAVHQQMSRASADESNDYNYAVVLLKSVGAYESFRKLHPADVTFNRALQFMLTHRYFPHSVQYALSLLDNHVAALQLHERGKAAMAAASQQLAKAVHSAAEHCVSGETTVTETELNRLLLLSGQLGYAASSALLANPIHVGVS
ncbi:alpha-E domain-containing protein [Paenibacillus xylaniclasticus]|uniref:alpha-E domain-containing protein n=1 Tax=Paenibacillus xylaniclasticus TaxID=588083 RepID=UPI000FD7F415|nr:MULTISPECIES: alpha-E domain-containing protein [Paenibacillus]